MIDLESIQHKLSSYQSAENRRKECHRFWLHLPHAVILISNVRTSASKKINGMALIRTLTVSNTAFERRQEKIHGFRWTVIIVSICFLRGFPLIDGPSFSLYKPLQMSIFKRSVTCSLFFQELHPHIDKNSGEKV